MWERASSFIKKAGTIILLSSIIIWAGSCFGFVDGAFMFDTDMELGGAVSLELSAELSAGFLRRLDLAI